MSPEQFEAMLTQTLADRRLSGSEKRALKEVISEAVTDENRRALCRHQAFALARKELADPQAGQVLDWLEDVVKLLLPETGTSADQVIAEAYFNPGERCTKRVIGLLSSARRKVDICVFTVTDDRVSRAIVDAHRRGVAVRIITDNDKAQDLGSDIEDMARMGIPVCLDRTMAHMHHKFALFDESLLATGSYNWTRGAEQNMENILVTNDPRLISSFQQEFEKLWNELRD